MGVRAIATAEAVLRRDSLVGGTVLLQTVVLKDERLAISRGKDAKNREARSLPRKACRFLLGKTLCKVVCALGWLWVESVSVSCVEKSRDEKAKLN